MDNAVERWVVSGTCLELGTRYTNLNLGLDALQLRRHSWDWKPKEKATWQIKLPGLREINFVSWSLTLRVTGLTVTGE